MLVFNSGGFDSAGSLVEFLKNPGHTVPIVMASVNLCAGLASGLVLGLAYAGDRAPSSSWAQGYFAVVALEVGGPWLQWWVVLAAGLCNLQTYIATMTQASYMVCAMAEHGVLPRGLGRQSATHTPIRALLLCGSLSVVFLLVPFYANLSLQSILYSLCLFAEVLCVMSVRGPVTYVPSNKKLRLAACASPLLVSGAVLAAQDSRYLGATFATAAAWFSVSWALWGAPEKTAAGPLAPSAQREAVLAQQPAMKAISL